MENLKIVIAGAGAGKTHNLKEEVIKCLPDLDKYRNCAVITFTNAATEELKKRLATEIKVMPNVFIGTIHSFLIQFILNPYGKLLNLTQTGQIFVDGISYYNRKNKEEQKKVRISSANKWEEKGLLVYDKVFELAEKILENEVVFELFINRLQYLFIDEYQDNRLKIHNLWKKIIQANKTQVYLIGDPLQCIFQFSYEETHLENEQVPKNFKETPLNDLESIYKLSVESKNENRRSKEVIVNLINNFIIDDIYKQEATNKNNDIPIYFIDNCNPNIIIKKYILLKEKHSIVKLHEKNMNQLQKNLFEDLLLCRYWIDKIGQWRIDKAESKQEKKDLENFNKLYNEVEVWMKRLEKGDSRISTPMKELSRCILGIIGIKKKDFIRDIYDEIEYRKFCLKAYNKITKTKNYELRDLLISEICDIFNINISKHEIKKINQFKSLDDIFIVDKNNKEKKEINSYFSTVYSAKGLEATSVLVVSANNEELRDWLDFEKANTELDDKYRLGYVAFSRARDMLSITCLEEIDQENKEKLKSLGVEFY